jgi:hypothetical protein
VSRRDGLAIAGGFVALACAVLVALSLSWSRVAVGPSSFGLDLGAYEAAADRLVETGSPYSDELVAGPIANEGKNVGIGYFYPPPMAQAFALVRGVDHYVLAAIWTILQALMAFLLLPLVWRRAGGRPGFASYLLVTALAMASYPFQIALVIGNVSGWSALLVGLLLVSKPPVQGALAGGLSLLKATNAATLLASLVERRSRLPAIGLVLGLSMLSFVISPGAWWAWLEVLPNILRLPPGGSPTSVSLASMVRDTPIGGAAALASAMGGAITLLLALLLARREGLSHRVVVATVASSLLFNPTLWDHYLAVMIPILIATWPNVSGRWRALLVLGGLTHLVGWFGLPGVQMAVIMFGGFVAITISSLLGDAPGKRSVQGASPA